MNALLNTLVAVCALAFMFCNRNSIQHSTAKEEVIAFPGAEGFGKFASGGRGGKVFTVSNLQDNGTGSLREAVSAKGPRIIVFAVAGTIHLETPLEINSNATLAGQSAPGDGICIADQPVKLAGHNIIIRYLRFRMGDKYQNKGMVDGAGADDALGGTRKNNIIIDHCSISWSTDECFSIYDGDSTTLQWNLIAEPLNYSYHFETGDKDFEKHGYGGIWGGRHLTAHHNLFAHCNSRTPRFNGVRTKSDAELVDYRNNVIYNWGGNNVYGGEAGTYNIVANYYKYGPSTSPKVKFRIVNPTKTDKLDYGKFHVSGNFVEGSIETTQNNLLGIHTEDNKFNSVQPFSVVEITTYPALQAYDHVIEKVGASFRRDTLDQRVINEVKNRTGRFIDVQGGYVHGTVYAATIKAWPSLQSGISPADSDNDGIPDQWETAHKMDPTDASDASLQRMHKYYTNIEIYLNELLK